MIVYTSTPMEDSIRVSEEVRDALASRRAVVALETSVVAHGLPSPVNLDAARRCAARVRAEGAVPAFTGLVGGRIHLGMGDGDLERLASPGARAAKAQARDLAALAVAGRDGGTTVSATVAIAARAGVRFVATGGIGGVHRIAPGSLPAAAGDVSADLDEIARQPVCVVSAGPKAILDLEATSEALETRGIPVVGWRTREMPAFYADSSGVSLEHAIDGADQAAALLRLHWDTLLRREGVLLFVPPPQPLPRAQIEAAVADGLARAGAGGLRGKEATPFLLGVVAEATGGLSRDANLALLERNAEVAAQVAVALAASRDGRR